MNKEKKYFEVFSQFHLFQRLDTDRQKKLFDIGYDVELQNNSYLMKEGDNPDDIYMVLEGEFEILKYDGHNVVEHRIAILKPGDFIGELGALEGIKRTASVRALSKAVVRRFSTDKIRFLIQSDVVYYKLFFALSVDLAKRIRLTSESNLQALQNQLEEIKLRSKMGTFFVNLVVFLCAFTCLLGFLQSLIAESASSTFYSLLFLAFCSIALMATVMKLGIPFHILGFTRKRMKRAILESIFFTLIVLAFLVLLKFIGINTIPSLANEPLFRLWQPPKEVVFFGFELSKFYITAISILLYAVIGCYMQEVIARGGMQGLLSYFLVGKYKNVVSILFANILFSTVHIFVSKELAILVFIPGLYFGWLFARHKTLIGCTIAHIILGTFSLFFMGIPWVHI